MCCGWISRRDYFVRSAKKTTKKQHNVHTTRRHRHIVNSFTEDNGFLTRKQKQTSLTAQMKSSVTPQRTSGGIRNKASICSCRTTDTKLSCTRVGWTKTRRGMLLYEVLFRGANKTKKNQEEQPHSSSSSSSSSTVIAPGAAARGDWKQNKSTLGSANGPSQIPEAVRTSIRRVPGTRYNKSMSFMSGSSWRGGSKNSQRIFLEFMATWFFQIYACMHMQPETQWKPCVQWMR